MRHTHIALLTLAGCLTLAAAGPKDVTYLKGTLEGVNSDGQGTLDLSHTKAMVLKSGSAKVEIPYLAVTNSESKEQPVFDEKEPMYKVWTLRKKLLPPTPLQEVTIEYKDAKGAANSVTLSMEKPLADWLAARLLKAEERKAELRGEWWGDQVWKTKRNETGWGGAGEIASRE